MAQVNVVATLNGIFKKRYAKVVKYAMPDGAILIRRLPFDSSKAIGADYNAPVTLQHENGFTFGRPGSGAFTIKNPVASETRNALVDGYQIALQAEIDYESAAKASEKGEKAIANSVRHVIRNVTESHKVMLEIQAFWGQADIGVVESAVAGASGTVTITPATWAPGIWAGREGMRIDVLNAALSAEDDSAMVVTGVNFVTRTITFDNVAAGVGAGDRLFFEDAVTDSTTTGTVPLFFENLGIHAALTAASPFGISTTEFGLWDSPFVDAGAGLLDMDHYNEIAARIAEKGGIGRLLSIVSSLTFGDLIGDQAALRRYDEEGSTARYRTGASAITFYTGNGEIAIEPSIYMKRGFSHVLNMRTWSRTGAQDMSFSSPFSSEAFHVFEGKIGAFTRSYSNVSMFSDALGQNGYIQNIVNSSN